MKRSSIRKRTRKYHKLKIIAPTTAAIELVLGTSETAYFILFSRIKCTVKTFVLAPISDYKYPQVYL